MSEVTKTKPDSSEFKHLVIVKFKEDVNVEEIIKGLQKLVDEIDSLKSFEWGQDMESQVGLRQGYTHAFIMSFEKKQDYFDFVSHQSHVSFSSVFSSSIDQILLLDFHSSPLLPVATSSSPPPPPPPPPAAVEDAAHDDTVLTRDDTADHCRNSGCNSN
ncbi:PREDICTED: stress-response A/B barrel domain-containing protein At5g22580-like [Tarenaya hassleriana]|uniref:stress-response A/B barrel domain-containing protein At5g22580-like n=1 Tax=Tarenaya hassleriana TaxID=28532 RepID=UPI00053C2C8F|nr:PREDICTED: stress-response A/B barrel domain-containing protein At5g22580-like [Tarenaya hassleriana]